MIKVTVNNSKREFFIDRFEFPNKEGGKPKHMVVFSQARASCAKAGKRLCTDWEWRQACMGPKMTNIFPYGPSYEQDRCYSGSILKSGHSGMTQEAKAIAFSGGHKGCKTPSGIYDMVGNLEEWVLSRWNGMHGILEGGAWFTIQRYASCTGDYSRQPQYRINLRVPVFSAGFRCCWSKSAPTEAELSLEDLERDTKLRMAAARARVTKKSYHPGPEAELAPGSFIDMYEYPNRKGENPLVGVSWTKARKLCKLAGKRLCHVEEWERACAGKGWLNYPYGDNFKPGACAVEETGPSRSGGYPGCETAKGVQDLSGGVWEWTADKMDAPIELYEKGKTLRHVRGGSWYVNAKDATCRPEMGYPTAPEYSVFPDLGFRCCRGKVFKEKVVAEPGSATCPKSMVAVKDYCVDRYEFPNQKGEPPLHDLNYAEAQAACKSVGLHVCSGKEWLQACAGTSRRTWPYGYSYDPDLCHYGLVPDNDNNVAVCGSKPKCKTPEGIYDMAGNTWEWTSEGEGKMTLRGGGANISAGFARCNAQARAATSFSTYETGVRCCATAEEATKLIARGGRPNLQEILASLSNKVAEQKLQGFKVTPPDAGAPDLDGPDLQALDLPVPAKAEPDQKPAPSSPPGSPASKPAAVVLPRPVAAKPTPDLTQNRRPPPQADPSKRANVKPCSLRNVSCPSGLICCFNKSVCCLPPLTCKDNSVCSRGERCYKPHGRCYATCDRIDKCRDPFSCDKVAKICRPPGPTCGQSDECPNNMICHPRRFYCVK